MNKEITSKIIGQLKQNSYFADWWRSNEIEIPFFDNKKLPVIFTDFEPQHDTTFIEEADQALTNFLNLKTEGRNAISELVFRKLKTRRIGIYRPLREVGCSTCQTSMMFGNLSIPQKSMLQDDLIKIGAFIFRLPANVIGKTNTDFNWYIDKEKSSPE